MTPNQLIEQLIDGTYVLPDMKDCSRPTVEEFTEGMNDFFWPSTNIILSEICELLPLIAGYKEMIPHLCVKWGDSDPVEAPIKLPAEPTDSWDYMNSRVELYADQIRIVPKGEGAAAGDVVIWYSWGPDSPKPKAEPLDGDATSDYTNQDPDLKNRPPKRYYPDFTMYAEQLLDEAECKYIPGDITALTNDLSRRSNDFDGDMQAASEDLIMHIGGLPNLRAYVDKLKTKS